MSLLDYDIDASLHREWDGRAIMHLDLDAFFASVAQLDYPELRGKPVIIGSPGKRGVVATCSYEARPFGVRSAMSSSRAKQLCPDAIWVDGDFARYREFSTRVFKILQSYSPHILPISIDEAFLDITPDTANPAHPVDVATAIQEAVAKLGITCSIGLGTSMTIAKIGSDYQKPRGLTVIYPGDEAAFLAPMSIRIMSGIGRKTASRLEEIGVHTLEDLAQLSDNDATLLLGSYGTTMRDRAKGVDARQVKDHEPVKSVSNEHTFENDIREGEEVLRELKHLADKVTSRLRKKGLAGKTVSLKVRAPDFETHGTSRTVPYPVDDITQLMPIIEELLPRIWSEGQPVRLLGVGVSNFLGGEEQLSLLDDNAHICELDERRDLSREIDAIRAKYGSRSIKRGML